MSSDIEFGSFGNRADIEMHIERDRGQEMIGFIRKMEKNLGYAMNEYQIKRVFFNNRRQGKSTARYMAFARDMFGAKRGTAIFHYEGTSFARKANDSRGLLDFLSKVFGSDRFSYTHHKNKGYAEVDYDLRGWISGGLTPRETKALTDQADELKSQIEEIEKTLVYGGAS